MIDALLSPLTLTAFLEDYYLQRPYASRGVSDGPGPLQSLLGDCGNRWLEGLIQSPGADYLFTQSSESLDDAFSQGATVRIRHAERLEPGLAQVAEVFRQAFRAPVDVHVYGTPAGATALAWHYDAEDVFVFQLKGQKRWLLRKNTVNPWPLADSIPIDMQVEREIMPATGCQLVAGSWLYVPNGYWHRTDATEESVNLAIGISARTALDLLDLARDRLKDSLRWKQRLSPRRADEDHILEDLAKDFGRLLLSPAFKNAVWQDS